MLNFSNFSFSRGFDVLIKSKVRFLFYVDLAVKFLINLLSSLFCYRLTKLKFNLNYDSLALDD